jgi:hypothetical protein
MADPSGFEPPIFSVTGKRVGPLHYGSMNYVTLSLLSLADLALVVNVHGVKLRCLKWNYAYRYFCNNIYSFIV